jgi:tetratricopeptide (TPR) repeat protein
MTTSAELIQQGKAFMNGLQFQPAQKLFEKVLETEPKSVDARIGLGRLALISNQKDQGVKFLDEALQLHPNHAEALALKGVSKMQEEDWKAAVELFNQAKQSDPNLPMIYFNLAHSYRKLGNLKDAEAAARKAIELDAKDFQAHSELSYILGQTGKVKEGIEEMLKAIRINPLFLKGYLVLGKLYKTAGKNDAAIELYRQALKHLPSAMPVYEELCDLYVAKQDYKSAYLDAVFLITRRNNFRDYLRLGSYAVGIDDTQKAEKAFRTARKLKDDPQASDEFLKNILAGDNTLYEKADKLRKAIQAE